MSTIRIVVLAAVGLLLLSGTAFGLTEALRSDRRLHTMVHEPIHRIVIRADVGDVDIRAGLTADVVVNRHDAWLVERPKVEQTVKDGVLRIDARCTGVTSFRCKTDLRIDAPPEVDVAVRGGAGDVDLRGLQGRADIQTDAGNITAHRLEPVMMKAWTDAGDVRLDLFGQPTRTDARSDAGEITVVVPYGPYRVDAATDSGTVKVTGLLRDDLAPQRIEASTGAGDITVRAR